MRNDTSRAAIVAALVDEQFVGTPIPSHDSLVNVKNECDLERQDIITAFARCHWTEIPLPVLCYHHQSLFFFTPAAYRFFLPAFLRACVLSYDKAENIPESVIFSLTPPDPDRSDLPWFLERVEGFTLDQKQAIAEFIDFLRTEHGEDFPGYDLDGVLDQYWKHYR